MKTEKIANRCPKCQAPLPADAPQGLCAKCLLAAAATPTEAGQPPGERSAPPKLEVVVAAFPQLQIVELIGLSEGVVKVAVHRLRKRFRELVRAEVVQTVGDTAQVAGELRYLVEVLAQPEVG